MNEVPSPCVRNCCLDDDDICLGCFRHVDEITGWQASSNDKKRQVLDRCQQRKQLKSANRKINDKIPKDR